MKKNLLLCLAFFVFHQLTAQQAESIRSNNHVSGEILFQLKDNQSIREFEDFLDFRVFTGQTSFNIQEIAPTLHIFSLKFDPKEKDENELLARLKAIPSVSAVQFNHLVELRGTPNDPLFTQQWYLQKINTPSVWDVTTGGLTACGDTIVVAVIDGGFQNDLLDLKENVWVNKNEIPNNGIDDDGNGYIDDYQGLNTNTLTDNHTTNVEERGILHGTASAGLIGASGNNGKLMTGVNWKIKLMLFSGILQSNERGIIAAYDYVLQQRRLYDSTDGKKGAFIPVTSMSAGFNGGKASDFPLLCGIYETLNKQTILNIVAASDNFENVETAGDIPTLCSKEGLIIVTSTDKDDSHLNSYSTKYIHLAAPGKDILILSTNNSTETSDGTSVAAPIVAGAAALLWSMPETGLCELSKTKPLEAMNHVKDAILRGVDKLPSLTNKTITGGRLNIKQSFNLLRRSFRQPIGDFDILKLYPNPVANQLNIQCQLPENASPDILIINTLGQIVFQKKMEAKDLVLPLLAINTSDFSAGFYFLSLKTNDFEVTKKFVVAHK